MKENCLKISKNYMLVRNVSKVRVKYREMFIKMCSNKDEFDEKFQFCEIGAKKFSIKSSKSLTIICSISEIGAVQKNAHLVDLEKCLNLSTESS